MKNLKIKEFLIVTFFILSVYSMFHSENIDVLNIVNDFQSINTKQNIISANGSPHVVFDVAHGYQHGGGGGAGGPAGRGNHRPGPGCPAHAATPRPHP